MLSVLRRAVRAPAASRMLCSEAAPQFRYGLGGGDVADTSGEVAKALSLSNAAQAERNKANIQAAVKRFARFEGDTGSPEVQSAWRVAPRVAQCCCDRAGRCLASRSLPGGPLGPPHTAFPATPCPDSRGDDAKDQVHGDPPPHPP